MIKEFKESFDLKESNVDRGSNSIQNVCVLTPISKNHRVYLPSALEDCRNLMQNNTKCFINHGGGNVEDLIGDFYGAEVKEGKVFSNLSILEHTKAKDLLLEIASEKPHLLGLSINARGRFKSSPDAEGNDVCESILELHSVDVVGFPATTQNLYEQREEKKKISLSEAREILSGKNRNKEEILKAREITGRKD